MTATRGAEAIGQDYDSGRQRNQDAGQGHGLPLIDLTGRTQESVDGDRDRRTITSGHEHRRAKFPERYRKTETDSNQQPARYDR